MVAMLATQGQIDRWGQTSKRLEIVDEMRLVEIAAGQRQLGPSDGRVAFQQAQDLLKAAHAAKLLRRQAHRLAEDLNKACLAQADALCHCRDAWQVRGALELLKRIADGR